MERSTRKSWVRSLSAAAAIGLAAQAALATQYDFDVAPGDLATGKAQFSPPHGTGTNGFGYDWDSSAPGVASGAPTGYGSNSFYADVDVSGATTADRYRTLRIAPGEILGQPVSIGDVAKITYYTNKPDSQTQLDWRVTIYTTAGDKGSDPNDAVQGSGDLAKWYRSRIQSLPNQSLNLNAPANQWNLWDTDDSATNQLQFYSNRFGSSQTGDIDWSDLIAGDVTRNATTWDFTGEDIMMIDFIQGADNGGWTGYSQIDGIRIELTNGDVANINLVPEPSAIGLLGVGALALLRRPRRK